MNRKGKFNSTSAKYQHRETTLIIKCILRNRLLLNPGTTSAHACLAILESNNETLEWNINRKYVWINATYYPTRAALMQQIRPNISMLISIMCQQPRTPRRLRQSLMRFDWDVTMLLPCCCHHAFIDFAF